MNCPTCNRELHPKKTTTTTNPRTKKTYDWAEYTCSTCDVWLEEYKPHKDE